MWYALAADLIAVVHLAFIAFVVFGVVLGRRRGWWRGAHLAAMIYGVLIEIFYWPCPLTFLEQNLREQSGEGAYTDPFIAHYVNKFIYIDVSQGALIVAAAAVLALNGGYYFYSWGKPTSSTS